MRNRSSFVKITAYIFVGFVAGALLSAFGVWEAWQRFDAFKVDAESAVELLAAAASHIISERGQLVDPFYINNTDESLATNDMAHEIAGDGKSHSTDSIVNRVRIRLKYDKIEKWSERAPSVPCKILPGCANKDDYVSVSVRYMPFSHLAVVSFGTLACFGDVVLVRFNNGWHILDEKSLCM